MVNFEGGQGSPARMRFVVNGKLRDTLTVKEARQVKWDYEPFAGSVKVLSPAAAERKARLGCLFGIGIATAAIWSVLLLNLLFADPRIDNSALRTLIVLAGLIVPILGFGLKDFAVEGVKKDAVADYAASLPPGTRIAVDDAGLSVDSRLFSWDEIAIERWELLDRDPDDGGYLVPFTLHIVTPAGPLCLSYRILDDDFSIVRQIHRRLWPRVLTELGLPATRP